MDYVTRPRRPAILKTPTEISVREPAVCVGFLPGSGANTLGAPSPAAASSFFHSSTPASPGFPPSRLRQMVYIYFTASQPVDFSFLYFASPSLSISFFPSPTPRAARAARAVPGSFFSARRTAASFSSPGCLADFFTAPSRFFVFSFAPSHPLVPPPASAVPASSFDPDAGESASGRPRRRGEIERTARIMKEFGPTY